jgi:uncharacterized membrane protein YphA (DoxX/SURF4 family)
MDSRITSAFWTLRIAIGATAFLAGLDKFFNLLVNWETYVSPVLTKIVPLSPPALMHVAGVIEMIAGLAVLTGVTRFAGYIVAAWLTMIALSLLTTGHFFDVAVRDLVMAAGAYTLARLTAVRAAAESPAVSRGSATLRSNAA